MKPATYGPFYAAGLYPKLAEIFRAHGYALAVHGSVGTDFDLVAIPWTDVAADPQLVIDEVQQKFAAKFARSDDPESKPHGRIAYKLALSFGTCALDISFVPRQSSIVMMAALSGIASCATKCACCRMHAEIAEAALATYAAATPEAAAPSPSPMTC